MFIFDTDHLSILQSRSQPYADALLRRIAEWKRDRFFVTIVSFHEQVLGWNAFINKGNRRDRIVNGYAKYAELLREYSKLQVLHFDDHAADRFESLRQQRVRIATMDLRIAAIALTQDMTVLTRNGVDFAQVPDLRWENWTK